MGFLDRSTQIRRLAQVFFAPAARACCSTAWAEVAAKHLRQLPDLDQLFAEWLATLQNQGKIPLRAEVGEKA